MGRKSRVEVFALLFVYKFISSVAAKARPLSRNVASFCALISRHSPDTYLLNVAKVFAKIYLLMMPPVLRHHFPTAPRSRQVAAVITSCRVAFAVTAEK